MRSSVHPGPGTMEVPIVGPGTWEPRDSPSRRLPSPTLRGFLENPPTKIIFLETPQKERMHTATSLLADS